MNIKSILKNTRCQKLVEKLICEQIMSGIINMNGPPHTFTTNSHYYSILMLAKLSCRICHELYYSACEADCLSSLLMHLANLEK